MENEINDAIMGRIWIGGSMHQSNNYNFDAENATSVIFYGSAKTRFEIQE